MGLNAEGNQGGIPSPEPKTDLHSGAPTLTETLGQLLASKTFSRSGQLKRLFAYLREATASTDPAVWSETAIGVNAFGWSLRLRGPIRAAPSRSVRFIWNL